MEDSKALARISDLEDKLNTLGSLTYETFQELEEVVGNLTELYRGVMRTQIAATEMVLAIARRQGTPLDESVAASLLESLRKASEDPKRKLTPAELETRLREAAEEHAKWTALIHRSPG